MHKLLIVDDERVTRDYIKYILEDRKMEFVVFEASDGEEAVELVKQQGPEIIFMDLRMPGMGGLEAIRAIRQIDRDALIFVLTAHEAFEYAQQALRLGVRDYFLKPLEPSKVVEILNASVELLEHGADDAAVRAEGIAARSADVEEKLSERIEAFMETRLGENLSLGRVAGAMGYSKYHFSRRFKELFSETFSVYLKRKRIGKASKLIKETDLKLSSIAKAVGMPNYSYFTKVFKSQTGMTPGEMRRSRHSNKVL